MSSKNTKDGATEGKKYLYEFPDQHEYEGMLFPTSLFPAEAIDACRKYEFKQGDVLIASYPKSGTSWAQELVWLICNNADTATAKKSLADQRVPYMEFRYGPGKPCCAEMLAQAPSPRLSKTHLPYHHYEPEINKGKVKVVYIVRNPKDALVSFYNFYKMNAAFGFYPGSWNDFFELFRANQMNYGSWFDNVLPFWNNKDKTNVLFMKYEDMKKDLPAAIRKMADYIGKKLTAPQVATIAEHCTFKNMQDNPMTNKTPYGKAFDFENYKFIRKGQVGDWKNYFTVAQNEYFDAFYKEKMAGSGLDIEFEL